MSSAQIAFSPEAHAVPFNSSATLAVKFTLIAEKEVLPCLQAFCKFLGKTHETTPCSSWSSGSTSCAKRESNASRRCSSAEAPENEDERGAPPEAEGQGAPLSLPVEFELPLTPFSVPPTFCEPLVNETLTVFLMKTPDPVTEGNQGGLQRKEQSQSKGFSKQDGKEKAGKKGAPPKAVVPQGDMRTAEFKAAQLFLLKDGETMQAPEEAQQTLSSIPGIVSLRLEIKAIKSLLSPELRILLNPVWLLIKEVRNLPLSSRSSSSVHCASNDAPENVCGKAAEKTPGRNGEACCLATETMRIEPRHYFARLSLFSRVFETQPVREELNARSTSSSVCWNFGFLCFWGPAVIDQNKLKDLVEEQKLEVELFNSEESLADFAESEVAWAHRTPESKPVLGHCSAKSPKHTGNSNGRKKSATAGLNRGSQGGCASDLRPSDQLLSDESSSFLNKSETPKIKPPHGLAVIHLNALSSCRATHLSFCTDVLPVAGFSLVRKGKEGKTNSLCRANGPDFIGSGTRMVFTIQLAEPLFRRLPLATASCDLIQTKQDGESALFSPCFSTVPNQLFNRIFIAAPLKTPLAAQLLKVEEREKAMTIKDLAFLNKPDCRTAESEGEGKEEGGNDPLTGFIIDDGVCLYSVLEGLAAGRLIEAAHVLVRAISEEGERKGEKVLYNSRLRFSERRYSALNSFKRIEIKSPLAMLCSSLVALDSNNSQARLLSSGLSKLQLCTLLSRAADLKCSDLFPSCEELKAMKLMLVGP